MKIRRLTSRILFALIFCALALVFAPGDTLCSGTITASGDDNYPPYVYLDDSGAPSGFSVDIFIAVAEVTGLEATVSLGPWSVVRADLEAGRVDMLIGMILSEERAQYVDFSHPHITMYHSMFIREDSDIRSIDDILGREVIVQRGDIMDDYIKGLGIAGGVVEVDSPAEGLRLLASGRHDCFLGENIQGLLAIERNRLDNVTTTGAPLFPLKFCFAVRNGDRELLEKLNDGLAIIARTGAYDEIYERWFGLVEPGNVPLRRILVYFLIAIAPVVLIAQALALWTWSLRRKVSIKTESLRRELAERRKAEDALRNSEEKYRSLFENSRDALGLARPDGAIIDVNRAWLELFGYTREEIIGRDVHMVYSDPADREKLKTALETSGYLRDYEVSMQRKDGTHLICLVTATVRHNPDGTVRYYQTNTHDITQQRNLELQFLQSQKMETVGRLAGGIAHDFNNLLSVIIGNTDLLLISLPPDSPMIRELNDIMETAGRAADLVRQLMAFSRSQITNTKRLNLNTVIADMDRMLRRLIGENILLSEQPSEGLWDVHADITQLQQVITNLVVNAHDAISDNGALTISTANLTIAPGDTYHNDHLVPGEYVTLTVEDDGEGIDPDVLPKIFDPFFTTKRDGMGTGLGLSTSYGIARQHGGTVTVRSERGSGAAFTVILPRYDGSVPAEEIADPEPESLTGSEHIFVIEDDDAVRKMIVSVLSRFGYTIEEASDGVDALTMLDENPGMAFDLVLSDIVMPNMSGTVFAEQLKARRPGAKILFMSGYTEEHLTGDTASGGFRFIHKPFKPSELTQAIRDILDETTGAIPSGREG